MARLPAGIFVLTVYLLAGLLYDFETQIAARPVAMIKSNKTGNAHIT